MTKREAGAQMVKKCDRLYGMAFDNRTDDLIALKMEVNALWAEVERAAEDRVIFKQDAERCYTRLREAFRWIRYHRNKIQK